MTVQEIKQKIEELKGRLFLMNMIDRWTIEDERRVNEIENEIRDLEMQVA